MSVIWFLIYLAFSLALLAGFTWAYIQVTPYDEAHDISEGKLAPAIALGGAMLGFTFPLLVASYTHSSLGWFLVWALIACAVQVCVFAVLHKLLPKVIATNNVAGAAVFAVSSVCAGLINAASFIP